MAFVTYGLTLKCFLLEKTNVGPVLWWTDSMFVYTFNFLVNSVMFTLINEIVPY